MSALNIVLTIVQLLLLGLNVIIFLGIRAMLKKAGLYKPKEKAKPAEPLPAESKSPYQVPKKKWRFDAAVARSIWANIQHFSRKHRKALIACLIVVLALGSVVIATESRYGTQISGFNEITIIEYRGNATSVEIPSRIYGMKVTRIGYTAFASHHNLKSVTIPDGVTSIGDFAFAWCSGLTSITIPEGVTSIGEGAFANCSGLTNITIPDGVKSMGNSVFYRCSNLASITIPNSVTSIGYSTFNGCTSLTSITIPNSVQSIGDGAFLECSNLTSVTIPDSVTSIGEGAFLECSNLTSITIPSSVTGIGAYAFDACDALENVYYAGANVEKWWQINIGEFNSNLIFGTHYYYSETRPVTPGNYWRYVDGVPTPW